MISRMILSLAFSLAVFPSLIAGQEVGPIPHIQPRPVNDVELTTRIDELEADLAIFQSRDNESDGIATVGYQTKCNGKCIGYCESCGGNYQFYGRTDLVFIKPHFSHGAKIGDPSFQYSIAPRFILGVRDQNRTGLRARYFFYQDRSSIGPNSIQTNLRMSVVDLELERSVDWGCTNVAFLGGVRYAQLDHSSVRGRKQETSGEGWGPLIGIETSTGIFNCGSMLANIRYAPMFGSGVASDDGTGRTRSVGSGSIETQIGYRVEQRLDYATVRFSSMLETHQWFGAMRAASNLGGSGDDDLLLLGVVFGIELLR